LCGSPAVVLHTPPEQSALPVHARHVFVVLSHVGFVGSVQSVFFKQPTHVPFVVLHTGVGAEQFAFDVQPGPPSVLSTVPFGVPQPVGPS
jgi:hypothetical protein